MKQPKLVEEIVTKVSKAIQKPLTVKIRKGFNDDTINAVEIAKVIEEAAALQPWQFMAGQESSTILEKQTGRS